MKLIKNITLLLFLLELVSCQNSDSNSSSLNKEIANILSFKQQHFFNRSEAPQFKPIFKTLKVTNYACKYALYNDSKYLNTDSVIISLKNLDRKNTKKTGYWRRDFRGKKINNIIEMIKNNYNDALVKMEILDLFDLIGFEETHYYFNKAETHFFIKEFKDGRALGLPSIFPYDVENIHLDSIYNMGTREFIEKNGYINLKKGVVVKHKSFDPKSKEFKWFTDTIN